MNFPEIIAFLVVAVGAVGRVKYIWAGNKIRRQESTKDASCKFFFVTHIIYWIMFIHNFNQLDWADMIFWFVGLFTTAYANIMAYKYSGLRGLDYFRYMFKSEEEGGVWR
ncbi:MAG: hypothetical protein NWE89_02310 [Candidatus Bathyarchaeota archaeon]|nr:hypothetical protein [Candidatus Bathyarchaeota archaeon]